MDLYTLIELVLVEFLQKRSQLHFLDSQWGLSKFIAMKVSIFVIGWTRYGMAILGTFQQFFCRQKLSIRVRTCSDIRYVRNPYLSPLNVYIFVVQTGSFTSLNSVNMLTPLENGHLLPGGSIAHAQPSLREGWVCRLLWDSFIFGDLYICEAVIEKPCRSLY